MAIRTKKYRHRVGGTRKIRALVLTEKNLPDVVAYICKNDGAATGHLGNTASGRPARIRLKQRNYGETWGKTDWRVAKIGDIIVIRHLEEFVDEGFKPLEFARMKPIDFHDQFEEVK